MIMDYKSHTYDCALPTRSGSCDCGRPVVNPRVDRAPVYRLAEIAELPELGRQVAAEWEATALRLLIEVRVYRGESNRAWYTGAELAVLDVLESLGTIEQLKVVRNGRERRNYRLTPKGDEVLDAMKERKRS